MDLKGTSPGLSGGSGRAAPFLRAPLLFACLCCLICLSCLSGCLYSTHNFSAGRILPEGRSEATLGVGRQPVWSCEQVVPDTVDLERACNEDGLGAELADRSDMPKGSFGYRLGIRDAWGPFPGLELRWHLEAPTNPATMEFGLNLGLPTGAAATAAADPSGFRHALGAGWGIGAWADKTFYAEYAASRRIGLPLLFSNLRVTYLATQIGEVLGEDFAKPFPSNQHWVFQGTFGAAIPVGRWPMLPDVVIPAFSLTLPQIPSGRREFRPGDIPLLQWDATLGIGWSF